VPPVIRTVFPAIDSIRFSLSVFVAANLHEWGVDRFVYTGMKVSDRTVCAQAAAGPAPPRDIRVG